MPSQLHEALLELFRNRPLLAPELLRDVLHVDLPEFSEAHIGSANLTDIQPAEYRADVVVVLRHDAPSFGIIVEVQLAPDERKRFTWPMYTVGLRARLKCPVCLLVVTADEFVARWALNPIDIGGGNYFTPLVLRPSGVPEVTDEEQARSDPELAVLSSMAHGHDADTSKAVRIAVAARFASQALDADRSRLYFDLILSTLSEAARRALSTMDMTKYEYQSDFARHYLAQGEAQGRAALISKLMERRFGVLADGVRLRIAAASIVELDEMGERLFGAQTIDEVLG